MISQMKIMGENEVWIPGGLGWYRAEVIKKILSQEKKLGWAKNIFIYSLGFYPDKIVWTEKIDDWKSRYWWQMLKNNNLLNKNENLSGGIEEFVVFHFLLILILFLFFIAAQTSKGKFIRHCSLVGVSLPHTSPSKRNFRYYRLCKANKFTSLLAI